MSYAQHLKDLLAPLNVYSWDQSFQWAELLSEGKSLDACAEELERIQREMNLLTAEDQGLSRICSLLVRKPVAEGAKQLRDALAALLRIGDRSFTLKAIRDNLSGCGVTATVEEMDSPGKVAVSFPDVPGIPVDFSEIKTIIEDIIPCHLEINYLFWYITWAELEQKLPSWRHLEEKTLTWRELEAFVEK
jgi:hypothetical protein